MTRLDDNILSLKIIKHKKELYINITCHKLNNRIKPFLEVLFLFIQISKIIPNCHNNKIFVKLLHVQGLIMINRCWLPLSMINSRLVSI